MSNIELYAETPSIEERLQKRVDDLNELLFLAAELHQQVSVYTVMVQDKDGNWYNQAVLRYQMKKGERDVRRVSDFL